MNDSRTMFFAVPIHIAAASPSGVAGFTRLKKRQAAGGAAACLDSLVSIDLE